MCPHTCSWTGHTINKNLSCLPQRGPSRLAVPGRANLNRILGVVNPGNCTLAMWVVCSADSPVKTPDAGVLVSVFIHCRIDESIESRIAAVGLSCARRASIAFGQ